MSDDTKLVKSTRKPPRAGMGRKAGSVNKHTAAVKDMILAALDKAGGVEYLTAQAAENPAAFMGLLGKILPKDVNANVSGSIDMVLADRLKEARERAH